VGVLQLLLPGFGAESEDVASGVGADAGEHVAQVGEGVEAVQLAGGEQGPEDGSTLGALRAAGKHPVFAPDGSSRLILPMSRFALESSTRGTPRTDASSTCSTVKFGAARSSSSA